MVEFMQQGTIIMSETLKKKRRAIHDERCGMLRASVVLLHDNAHLQTAACTWALLEHFKWELFDHPPYSPDLALSNYPLLTYLKS
jgi:histone-lysine N-methyltransferase SETMAR